MTRIYQTFYKLFPEHEWEFVALDEILALHYRKRLENLQRPTFDEVQSQMQKAADEMGAYLLAVEHDEEPSTEQFPIKALAEYLKYYLRFLGNSYLVKSASLLEGFVWSINIKSAHLAALTLRQEIEVLAVAHDAHYFTTSGKFERDPVKVIQHVAQLLFGVKDRRAFPIWDSIEDTGYVANNILNAIDRFDSCEKEELSESWLRDTYSSYSELVHPNFGSNIVHVKDNQHFWKIDYGNNKALLEQFLVDGTMVFGRTIDLISKLLAEDLEIGFEFIPRD